MRRIAFVIQRCGEEIVGGAEAHCLAVAERLNALAGYDVTILTTCARDYTTWRDTYPAGHSRVRGVHVIRFPVRPPRDPRRFDRISRAVRAGSDAATEAQWMREQGPNAPELRAHVAGLRAHYDAFVFFGYLYATTYDLLPLVADRALLLPLAHDEWPIHLRLFEDLFERPAAFLYNTIEERDFVLQRFPNANADGALAGIGLEPPAFAAGERFRATHGVAAPFVLYHGRIDESKGCAELVRSYQHYRKSVANPSELVLVGDVKMRVPSVEGVRVIGRLDERGKWDALDACDAVVTLSPHESLSISMLEGWAMAKPSIVSSRAAALVGQCRRAQAGVWVANDDEFAVAMATFDGPTRERLGRRGQRFVTEKYRWEPVLDVYVRTLERVVFESRRS